jgi:hypothetical protein
LNGRPAHADEHAALGERGENLTQPRRAFHRVKLGGIRQTRRGVKIVVGAQRDHHEIPLVRSAIRCDALGHGIDRRDCLLEKPHAGLHESLIRESHRVKRRVPEHDVELRVAENKGVVLIDQRHVDAVAIRLGEHGAEFEPSEAGAENEDALFHGITELIVNCTCRSTANEKRTDSLTDQAASGEEYQTPPYQTTIERARREAGSVLRLGPRDPDPVFGECNFCGTTVSKYVQTKTRNV